MIKKLSLMLLLLCSLSMLSPSAKSHDGPRSARRSLEERPERQHHHPSYSSRCRPRFMRPYGFYNYGYYGPRRRGSEFYIRFGGPHRNRGGFGIGFSNYGW